MKELDLKTIVIATLGTGASFSLAKLSLALSCIAAALTIVYTALRIIELWEARVEKRKNKGTE
jgi:hypothetical protein